MFNDDMTLLEAQEELRERIVEGEAVPCPTCSQLAKVYRRNISARQAFTLIEVWKAAGLDWCHVPSTVTFNGDSGELSKLRYWGLVEEATEKREDGGRAGWWRITEDGANFLLSKVKVLKYARIYDGRLLGFDHASGYVSISDALGSKFDYSELMSR